MDAEEMLSTVSEYGEDAASDYNDGLDGWFGFRVNGDLLTITWKPAVDDGPGPAETRTWRLVQQS